MPKTDNKSQRQKLTFLGACYQVVGTFLDNCYVAECFAKFRHFVRSIAALTT